MPLAAGSSWSTGGWASYAGEKDVEGIPDPDLSSIGGAAARMADASEIGRQTLVPGFMAGVAAMHARFGRLPWADLFQPAIWYAENGVTVTPARAGSFRAYQMRFWRTPEGMRFVSMPDGSPPKPGDVLRQPDLARTLKGVAAGGEAYMYRGRWAKAYVAAVRARGGKVSLDDLARYRPIWRDPIAVRFAGAEVYGMGESSLACSSLVALGVLSAMGIERMGPYWRDPTAFKAYARAIRFATVRQYWQGRVPFEDQKGIDGSNCRARLEPAYAAAVAPDLMMATPSWPFGPSAPAPAPEPGHHTHAVIAVDTWGDVAVLVHTMNGAPTGIVVGGVALSEAGAVNKHDMEGLKPGDHVQQDLAPLIAMRNGKPVLAIGAIGTSLGPETVRLAGEMLARRADLRTVQGAPPLLGVFTVGQTFWATPQPVPAAAYDEIFLNSVAAAGVPTETQSEMHVLADLRGEASLAIIDEHSGAPASAEVPLSDGYAETDLQQGVRAIQPITVPTSVLDSWAGDYSTGDSDRIMLRRAGDHLVMITGREPKPTELFAVTGEELSDTDGRTRVGILVDPSGKASAVVVHHGLQETVGRRSDGPPGTAPGGRMFP